MANMDTGWILKTTQSGYAKATGEATVSNISDTVARLTIAGRCFGDTIIQNGVRCTIGHNAAGAVAAHSASNTGVLNAGDWVAQCSGYWDFPRQSAAYNVTCYVQFNGETVSGWLGFYRGSDSSSGPFVGYATVMIPAIPITIPDAPETLINTRVSDNQNTLEWTNNPSTTKPYTSLVLQRAVNDVSNWVTLVTLSGNATSYADTTTQANSFYTYRIAAVNSAGTSGYAGSGTTWNTPATPTNLVASRTSATEVAIDFSNTSRTENAFRLQRSTDKVNWVDAALVEGYVWSQITQVTDDPGAGTFYYRLRAEGPTGLVSNWSASSNAVVTIAPPAAPTLKSPASGGVVSKSSASVRLEWLHNPVDGSGQTAAQVRYSTDNGVSWTTQTINNANQYIDLTNSFAVNASVTWQVRTKGAHTDYGDWSAVWLFKVCQAPQVTIISPVSGATLIDMPLIVSWSYSDQSGSQINAVIRLVKSGVTVWSKTIVGTTTSYTIHTSEILPVNLTDYTIQLTATSSTSLTAQTTCDIHVDYIPPADPNCSIEIDERLGSVAITAFEGVSDPALPNTTSLGIFRRNPDGSMVMLVDNVPSGTGYYDIYPPIDQSYEYVIVAYTATGLSASYDCNVIVPAHGSVFFNFGNGYQDVAKIVRDRVQYDRFEPTVEVVGTAGNSDPLVFFGIVDENTGQVSGNVGRENSLWPINDPSTYEDIKRLRAYHGIVILRRPSEPVITVALKTISFTEELNPLMIKVEVAWVKVRSYGLVL